VGRALRHARRDRYQTLTTAPMSGSRRSGPNGTRDDNAGVREFVVGMAELGRMVLGRILPNSEVRDNATYGVLPAEALRDHL